VAATINILVFHYRVQNDRERWDTDETPPRKARISAAVSIIAWVSVITFGRFIAYDWYECGKPLPHWANLVQECAVSERGAIDLTELAK
jgi:hypothetical protein